MNPYRSLAFNTFLFVLSTFGSRFLNFLLTPFYTRILSSAEYGVTDLLIQTGNLLIPIASASIANAVIRYGLERSGDKSGVFTTALLVDLAGFVLLLDGRIVCVCRSVRKGRAYEAGIETLASCRRQGHALCALSAWTAEVLRLGVVPLYAAHADNAPSLSLAKKAGYLPYAHTFEYFCD